MEENSDRKKPYSTSHSTVGFAPHKHHCHPYKHCYPMEPPHSKCIVVSQVVGEGSEQKTIDVCVVVPPQKPSVEQIMDVYVRKVCVTDVDVRTDRVVVCGHFEVKVAYTACKPDQPVHAVEVKRVRFTASICIPGARCGMDADASVFVEYVDYDCGHHDRHYGYDTSEQYYQKKEHDYCPSNEWEHKHGKPSHDCDEDLYWEDTPQKPCYDKHPDDCDDHKHHHNNYYNHTHKKPCWEDECQHDHCHDDHDGCHNYCKHCFRKFDVSVVLCITAKVMTDRQLVLEPPHPSLPITPKG